MHTHTHTQTLMHARAHTRTRTHTHTNTLTHFQTNILLFLFVALIIIFFVYAGFCKRSASHFAQRYGYVPLFRLFFLQFKYTLLKIFFCLLKFKLKKMHHVSHLLKKYINSSRKPYIAYMHTQIHKKLCY